MPTLHEEAHALEQLRVDYDKKWNSYPTKTLADGKEARDIPATEFDELNKLQDAMAEKGKVVAALQKIEAAAAEAKAESDRFNAPQRPNLPGPTNTPAIEQTKSLSQMFMDSAQFKNRSGGKVSDVEFDNFNVKNYLGLEQKFFGISTPGYVPEIARTGVAFSAQRPPQVMDALPVRYTNASGIKFMLESTFTNNAAATAEGSAPSESVLVFTETTAAIEKVPVWIAISEEQLDDVEGIQGLVEDRLSLMLKQKLDDLIIGGNGTTPQIDGLLNFNSISTFTATSYTFLDAIRRMIDVVNVTGRARASVGFFHSTDVMNGIDLLKNANGDFVFPGGLMGADGVRRVWGLPIVETQAGIDSSNNIKATVGLVLDAIGFVTVVMRKNITLAITEAHSDYFTKNLLALRGTARMGLEVRRATAICKSTTLVA